ncbi:biofilm-dependent modulation protein [Enterobacteriaceae bacterium 4M9]|nr:biofilm-dependent modulation protein [Enterobacteriaceae bacterium 4M9]
MLTNYRMKADANSAHPALIEAIALGLHAERGSVTEDDVVMELFKWIEASDNDILSDIYQQTIHYIVDGQRTHSVI